MFVDNYSSVYSNLDMFSSYDSFSCKRRIYYETALKKKKEDSFSNINISNSLLYALKHFAVKFDLDNKKLFKDYKYIVSFDELISLIRYTLESQKKINEYGQEKSNNIKNFTSNYINNISNYINSYEKVEIINPIPKKNNKILSSSNKEPFNINSRRNNKRKSSACIMQSSNCCSNTKKANIRQSVKRETLTKNNQDNLINNQSSINSNHIVNKTSSNINDNNKNITLEEDNNYTKSYFKRKKYKNLSSILSPIKKLNNTGKKENKIKLTKSRLNKSTERRSHKLPYNASNKNGRLKINLNKSMEKRSNNKSVYGAIQPLSIMDVCEFIRSSSFIIKNKNNEENKLDKKSNYNSSNSLNDINIKKNEKKQANEKGKPGIIKTILQKNLPRPSNLANKLLEKGIKYISDFNGLKEEEQRKKFH